MKRFHHPLLALLLSLLLIGSQQGVFAHLLSHLHGGSKDVTHYQIDHGALDQIGDSCTLCIAFAGIDDGAPSSCFTASLASFEENDDYRHPPVLLLSPQAITCRARGPPAVISL